MERPHARRLDATEYAKSCNRIEQYLRHVPMTHAQKGEILRSAVQAAISQLALGMALVCFISCTGSGPRPPDVAIQLVPNGSVIKEDIAWIIGPWSARKTYVFVSGMSRTEYLSWAARTLGRSWECRSASENGATYWLLDGTEQHLVDITLSVMQAGKLHVQVTYTRIPT
jgi:hypothetical protein